MQKHFQYLSIILLCLSVITLLGLHLQLIGWFILILGALTLIKSADKEFSRDLILLYGAIAVLAVTPINPDISWKHIFMMGAGIFSVILFPFLISRYIYKSNSVTFKFQFGKRWSKLEISYLVFSVMMAYLVLPFYLKSTGAYTNWVFEPSFDSIARFFIGINVVGIWDELFFINMTLGVLKKYLSFVWANITQAVIFSAVLYEFGFIQWGFLMIFAFALLQGYIFNKSQSLFYIITVHLSLDFILFLALLNAHHPNWVPIFLLPMGA